MKIKKNKTQSIFKGEDRGLIYGLFLPINIQHIKIVLKKEKKRLKNISHLNKKNKTYNDKGKFEFNPKPFPIHLYNQDELDLLVVKEFEQFLKNGNYEHIYNAISMLGTFALDNDLIGSALWSLGNNYANALFIGDRKTLKKIENFASSIGKHLLDLENYKRNIKGKRESQTKILFVRLSGLEYFTKLGRAITYNDELNYIRNIYIKNHNKLKNRSDKQNRLTGLKSLLEMYNKRIKCENDREKNERWTKERKEITKKIKNLEIEENSIHKEAKRKTISELYQITGIEIGTRVLEEILAEANIRLSG